MLRRLIEFTQRGGEVNIVVTGINVGAQPYWNAEATMLMHTRGILVMTPASAMVLTGKQALDFSGGVSAEDNFGIGGFDRIMGPNGQGQYWAPDPRRRVRHPAAPLRAHLRRARASGSRAGGRPPTRSTATSAPSPHAADRRQRLRSRRRRLLRPRTTPSARNRSTSARSCARSPTPTRSRWSVGPSGAAPRPRSSGTRTSAASRCACSASNPSTLPRRGFVPAGGPSSWSSGTLFPQSSRKIARAVNAASGNRPLVVLANLSGFDGSPESMRRWQLEYGAEIGRAVTNFRGPIVFVVVSRYHGGAFVVFSKRLNERLEIAAVEGSFASVIGGAPAAATVFAREVDGPHRAGSAGARGCRAGACAPTGSDAGAARARLAEHRAAVRSAKLGEVADEFDRIHTVQRALAVGSVDRIIRAEQLRPYVVDALERGMARYSGRSQPGVPGYRRGQHLAAPRQRRAAERPPRGDGQHEPAFAPPPPGKHGALDGRGPSARPNRHRAGAPVRPRRVRVSRRRPGPDTFSALSFADQIRFATASRSSPAPRRTGQTLLGRREEVADEARRTRLHQLEVAPTASGPVGPSHTNRPPRTVADRHTELERSTVDAHVRARRSGALRPRCRPGSRRRWPAGGRSDGVLGDEPAQQVLGAPLGIPHPGQAGRLARRQPVFVRG